MRRLLLTLSILLLVGMACAATVTLLGRGVPPDITPGNFVNWTVSPLTVNKAKVADGGTTVALDIALNGTNAQDVVVQINKSGTARSDAENYGTGKNYTLSATQVTIPIGSTTPVAQPTCTIVNNPIYDLDQQAIFTLSIISPVGVSATANARIVNIADDGANRVYKNAVTDGSLDNTGTDDCSAALASLITTTQGLQSSDANGFKYGGVIYFPPGTYRIESQVTVPKGLTLVGDGVLNYDGAATTYTSKAVLHRIGYGATIEGDGITYWSALFIAAEDPGTGKTYNPVVIKGLEISTDADPGQTTIPGGSPWTSYEHNFNIGLYGADRGSGYLGLTAAVLDNLYLHDSISAGLAVSGNLNGEFYKIFTKDNHQAGIQPTYLGENVTTNFRKCVGYTNLPVSWGDGFRNENTRFDGWTCNIDDCFYGNPAPGYFVTFQPADNTTFNPVWTCNVNNVTAYSLDLYGPGPVVTISNSTFYIPSKEQRIQTLSPTFNNCTFTATEADSAATPHVYLGINSGQNFTATWNDCTFDATASGCGGVLADNMGNVAANNKLVFKNCTWGSAFQNVGVFTTGGYVEFEGGTWNNMLWGLWCYGGNSFNINFKTGTYNFPSGFYMATYKPANSANDTITMGAFSMNQNANIWDHNVTLPAHSTGARTITGSAGQNPNTIHAVGFAGDVFTNGTNTWDCTVSGFTNATWVQR